MSLRTPYPLSVNAAAAIVDSSLVIASILCSISQSNPRGAAHACSGNSFRGGVSPRFTRRPKGQSTVEYVLIIAIIVLVVLIAGPWVSSAITKPVQHGGGDARQRNLKGELGVGRHGRRQRVVDRRRHRGPRSRDSVRRVLGGRPQPHVLQAPRGPQSR